MVLRTLEVALPALTVEALSIQRIAFRIFNFLGKDSQDTVVLEATDYRTYLGIRGSLGCT